MSPTEETPRAPTQPATAPAGEPPVVDGFDPLSPAYLADPLAFVRDLPPVFYAPSLDYYVVTRYEDVEAIFLDHETFSAAPAQLPLVPLVPEAQQILFEGGHRPQPSMVSLDPPEHTRLRAPTGRAFTPRRVAEFEPQVRETVAELLDAVDAGGPFDVVARLTQPLPQTMIFRFMGVPREDWPLLRGWGGNRLALGWGRPTPEEQVEHATNMAAYRNYLRGLVASKAEHRADDFASALLAIHDEDPEQLTHEEIASILFSLSFAGHETTNNLLGNTIRRLLEAPSRWDAVVADPGLIPGVVDEVLRYDPSVTVWRRQAKRDVTVGGVRIPAGARLFLWLAAAGRDPSVFPEPDRFDPLRENARKTLTFGKGIHYCIGAALGKLEAQVAVELLAERFPGLRLVERQELSFHPNIAFRGPMSLLVEVPSVTPGDLPVTQDALGTHLDWEHAGITPRMIDWFWSNMEKGFLLWHPSEHEPLSWAVPVSPGNLVGAVHHAPQTWSDGTFRNIYIRFDDPSSLVPEIQERIVYEHCIVAAGLGFGPESLEVSEPMGYRVHQWQATDAGVVGRSSAIGRRVPETPEEGLVWAKHCSEEIGNWAAFLPQLYALYRVVERPEHNPYADLSVVRDDDGVVRYRAEA